MPGLENLTAKIMAIAEVKADAIVDEAKRDAQTLLEQASSEAEKQCAAIIAKAEQEATRLVSLAVSAKKTEIRNRILVAKQKIIAGVIAEAKTRLAGMSQNEYEMFLWNYLSRIDFSEGETLMIPKTYQGLDIDALNIKLHKAGKPSLTLSPQNVPDGFKLVNKYTENDNSLEALIDFYRSDLEHIAFEALFKADVIV